MFSLYLRVRKIYVNDKIPDPVDDGYVAFGVDQWVGGSLAYAVRRPRATPASGANTRCDRSPTDWTTPFCKQRCGDHRQLCPPNQSHQPSSGGHGLRVVAT